MRGRFSAPAMSEVRPPPSSRIFCDRLRADQEPVAAIVVVSARSTVASPPPRRLNKNSDSLHEAVYHALFAGFVEGDGELVPVYRHHIAVAEFLVEHAVAH